MSDDSHLYQTAVEWTTQRRGQATAPGLPGLEVAAPPEFDGHAGVWTPEHLFVSAIASCFMTTFLAIAQASRLDFVAFAASAEGRLEKVEGGYRMTEVTLRPRLTLRRLDDRERAERILVKAERACLISRSVISTVLLAPAVISASADEAPHPAT